MKMCSGWNGRPAEIRGRTVEAVLLLQHFGRLFAGGGRTRLLLDLSLDGRRPRLVGGCLSSGRARLLGVRLVLRR